MIAGNHNEIKDVDVQELDTSLDYWKVKLELEAKYLEVLKAWRCREYL